MNTKNLIILDQILAYISLAALILSHLALTDIAHGEPDTCAEWTILRVTAVLLFIFISLTLVTTRRCARGMKGQDNSIV